MSKEMEYVKSMVKKLTEAGFAAKFDGDIDPISLRRYIEDAQTAMTIEKGVRFDKMKFGDIDAIVAVPECLSDKCVIFYIHGGGLICGSAESSKAFASLLASETGFLTYALSYRLAPENPYPAAVEDCFAAYTEIIEKHKNTPVVVVGESGGAYLSIVTTLMARDKKVRMPAAVVAYSAITDMSGTINRNRPDTDDFTVTVNGAKTLSKMYCPDKEKLKEPYCSPYFAKYNDMPPMFLVWDEKETLAPDNELLVEAIQKENGVIKYKAYKNCFHSFATTGKGTPESLDALENTVSFIKSHV